MTSAEVMMIWGYDTMILSNDIEPKMPIYTATQHQGKDFINHALNNIKRTAVDQKRALAYPRIDDKLYEELYNPAAK